jgi:ribonuclease III
MRKTRKKTLSWWTRIFHYIHRKTSQRRLRKSAAAKRCSELDYALLQKRLGYRFRNLALLRQSLTHRSFANESGDPEFEDNEKLEFLGDSIIGFVISDLLYQAFPQFREGDLSRVKSHVVSEPFLARLARELDLGTFLLLGKGESASGGHKKSSLLSNCYEALVAAIYLDGGIGPAWDFLIRCFKDRIEFLIRNRRILDHKSLLQEHSQEMFNCIPLYRLRRITGPDHDRTFEITLMIKGEVFSIGTGKNRKEAEQAAAKAALSRLNINERRR